MHRCSSRRSSVDSRALALGPTFGQFRSRFRDTNGRYEYFRMDFRTPFPISGGVDHVVVDVPFESGRHGDIILRVTTMVPAWYRRV